ncbi:MAG TPA: riboflavin synthase [Gaiellaceae bacterium]|nr:riboflavin synthase [Gaiellaceae bacterium]
MFTGIVRERGRVADVQGDGTARHLRIEAPGTTSRLAVGDSVSVDGCCLTATEVAEGHFAVTAVPETISRTTLGALAPGREVNLETATRAGEPLGGHFVQGHVDGVGRVESVVPEEEGARIRVSAPAELLRYCVEKGSIAVGGVSLTIAALDDGAFEVALIPHTLDQTTLGRAQPGDAFNIEVDILAKYVEKLVHPGTISGA